MKKTDFLTAIGEMESTAFRVGQVARRFVADRPGLARAVLSVRTSADTENGRIDLHLSALDDVRSWAAEAGVEPVTRFHQYPSGTGFESLSAQTTVDEVEVHVGAAELFYSEETWETRLAEAGQPEVTGRAA